MFVERRCFSGHAACHCEYQGCEHTLFDVQDSQVVFPFFWQIRVACKQQLDLWSGNKEHLGETPSHQNRHPVLSSRNHEFYVQACLSSDIGRSVGEGLTAQRLQGGLRCYVVTDF